MAVQDLRPAAARLMEALEHVPEELLTSPTPCAQFSLQNLLAHTHQAVINYTAAATPAGDSPSIQTRREAHVLREDWRTRIPRDVEKLAEIWQTPRAWTGTCTRADGVRLPGDLAGLIALNELVLHGWDIARTISHPYTCNVREAQALHGFITRFCGPTPVLDREGLFAPALAVTPEASLFDTVLGLAGRDPAWTPG
jgi:uncharacterized protein (TIGR03086 family)